jgi:YD repeat-containing protein
VATQYTRNAFGEVLTETSPDIGTIQYTRDGAGRVTAVQDARGQISQITRDALGRPAESCLRFTVITWARRG